MIFWSLLSIDIFDQRNNMHNASKNKKVSDTINSDHWIKLLGFLREPLVDWEKMCVQLIPI